VVLPVLSVLNSLTDYNSTFDKAIFFLYLELNLQIFPLFLFLIRDLRNTQCIVFFCSLSVSLEYCLLFRSKVTKNLDNAFAANLRTSQDITIFL